ncbi:NADPH:quinone oxidoreductase family protein [Luminiphilus syltensis]|nr:NADPH:quinone oxidoreductase family protein [Luminiphilus syltensis]
MAGTTRALVCREHGNPDTLDLSDEWPLPELGPRDVQIRVLAAGLNFPDVLIVQGKYQIQPDLPFVPGGECAGIVEATGDAVTRVKVGEPVIHIGFAGAFAEQIVVDEKLVVPKPGGLDFIQAAGVAITYFTSYHGLVQRAALQPGETLLVLGAAGGVGSSAIELGKALGARVIAAASTDEKLEYCRSIGADEGINYSTESLKDRVKALTEGRGVDVTYDPVGGDFSEQAVRAMGWNGRHLVIGFASGPIPSIPLNLALLKGCSIIGVFYGRFMNEQPDQNQANIEALWDWFDDGTLNPQVDDVFPIDDYAAGYGAVTGRRAKGKVVFTFDP